MSESNSGPGAVSSIEDIKHELTQPSPLSEFVEVTIVVIGKIKMSRSDYTPNETDGRGQMDNTQIRKYEEQDSEMDLYEQLEGCDTLVKMVNVEDA
jgi:hypothetical protein